jgi:hypothetical protein
MVVAGQRSRRSASTICGAVASITAGLLRQSPKPRYLVINYAYSITNVSTHASSIHCIQLDVEILRK